MKIYEIEENVFRLDVSMNDKFLMNVVNTFDDLFYDPADFWLLHSSVFSEHFKELTSSTIFN
jgi:hypothetical protein